MDKQKQTPGQPKISMWGWVVLLLALGAWNLIALMPSTRPEVALPYSAFVAQVRSGNVANVTITGDEITGQFVSPLTWPQVTPGTAASTPEPTPTGLVPRAQAEPASYTHFRTTFPENVGDPELMSLLEAHQVVVEVTAPPNPWLTVLLSNGLPLLLLIGAMVLLSRRATQGQDGLFSFGRTKARQTSSEFPAVRFEDVAGADEAKAELQEVVGFLKEPDRYHILGARIPRGILLVGAPGTGKTLMARAVSGEAGVPFFSLSASEFVEMFVGVGASRVRDLFAQAKQAAPSIVFIDELDAVGRRRGAGLGTVNDEREQTLNQLLVEMDGFDEHHEVIILAATNRPDVLDPALLRPGRFDRQVTIALPDRRGREGILRIHTRSLRLAEDVDLSILARTTTGFSGADLANLCNEAALAAARQNQMQVAMADFEEALDKILLGGVRPLMLDEHDRRVVAYHEAGHALVAWLSPAADPVHKVTIIPRGHALGVTSQLPGDDHYNYGLDYLRSRLTVLLGGRSAEETAIGDITTGAENDLVEATRLARRMVTRWGMSDLGLVAFQADEEHPFLGYELAQGRDYSEATAAQIDAEVRRLLDETHRFALDLLTQKRALLDRLVEALLHDETIDEQDLVKLLGERPEADKEATRVVPA